MSARLIEPKAGSVNERNGHAPFEGEGPLYDSYDYDKAKEEAAMTKFVRVKGDSPMVARVTGTQVRYGKDTYDLEDENGADLWAYVTDTEEVPEGSPEVDDWIGKRLFRGPDAAEDSPDATDTGRHVPQRPAPPSLGRSLPYEVGVLLEELEAQTSGDTRLSFSGVADKALHALRVRNVKTILHYDQTAAGAVYFRTEDRRKGVSLSASDLAELIRGPVELSIRGKGWSLTGTWWADFTEIERQKEAEAARARARDADAQRKADREELQRVALAAVPDNDPLIDTYVAKVEAVYRKAHPDATDAAMAANRPGLRERGRVMLYRILTRQFDADARDYLENTKNKGSRLFFEAVTGAALPATQKGTREFLDTWLASGPVPFPADRRIPAAIPPNVAALPEDERRMALWTLEGMAESFMLAAFATAVDAVSESRTGVIHPFMPLTGGDYAERMQACIQKHGEPAGLRAECERKAADLYTAILTAPRGYDAGSALVRYRRSGEMAPREWQERFGPAAGLGRYWGHYTVMEALGRDASWNRDNEPLPAKDDRPLPSVGELRVTASAPIWEDEYTRDRDARAAGAQHVGNPRLVDDALYADIQAFLYEEGPGTIGSSATLRDDIAGPAVWHLREIEGHPEDVTDPASVEQARKYMAELRAKYLPEFTDRRGGRWHIGQVVDFDPYKRGTDLGEILALVPADERQFAGQPATAWASIRRGDRVERWPVDPPASAPGPYFTAVAPATPTPTAGVPGAMTGPLSSIKVLFRAPEDMSLWGVPYEMREDVGQSPGDLWRARAEALRELGKPRPAGWIGGSKGPDLSDWIYLGAPGWWSDLKPKRIEEIKRFLAPLKDWIPSRPYEWTDLTRVHRMGGKDTTPMQRSEQIGIGSYVRYADFYVERLPLEVRRDYERALGVVEDIDGHTGKPDVRWWSASLGWSNDTDPADLLVIVQATPEWLKAHGWDTGVSMAAPVAAPEPEMETGDPSAYWAMTRRKYETSSGMPIHVDGAEAAAAMDAIRERLKAAAKVYVDALGGLSKVIGKAPTHVHLNSIEGAAEWARTNIRTAAKERRAYEEIVEEKKRQEAELQRLSDHRYHVAAALRDGHPVPADVLKDYPDLAWWAEVPNVLRQYGAVEGDIAGRPAWGARAAGVWALATEHAGPIWVGRNNPTDSVPGVPAVWFSVPNGTALEKRVHPEGSSGRMKLDENVWFAQIQLLDSASLSIGISGVPLGTFEVHANMGGKPGDMRPLMLHLDVLGAGGAPENPSMPQKATREQEREERKAKAKAEAAVPVEVTKGFNLMTWASGRYGESVANGVEHTINVILDGGGPGRVEGKLTFTWHTAGVLKGTVSPQEIKIGGYLVRIDKRTAAVTQVSDDPWREKNQRREAAAEADQLRTMLYDAAGGVEAIEAAYRRVWPVQMAYLCRLVEEDVARGGPRVEVQHDPGPLEGDFWLIRYATVMLGANDALGERLKTVVQEAFPKDGWKGAAKEIFGKEAWASPGFQRAAVAALTGNDDNPQPGPFLTGVKVPGKTPLPNGYVVDTYLDRRTYWTRVLTPRMDQLGDAANSGTKEGGEHDHKRAIEEALRLKWTPKGTVAPQAPTKSGETSTVAALRKYLTESNAAQAAKGGIAGTLDYLWQEADRAKARGETDAILGVFIGWVGGSVAAFTHGYRTTNTPKGNQSLERTLRGSEPFDDARFFALRVQDVLVSLAPSPLTEAAEAAIRAHLPGKVLDGPALARVWSDVRSGPKGVGVLLHRISALDGTIRTDGRNGKVYLNNGRIPASLIRASDPTVYHTAARVLEEQGGITFPPHRFQALPPKEGHPYWLWVVELEENDSVLDTKPGYSCKWIPLSDASHVWDKIDSLDSDRVAPLTEEETTAGAPDYFGYVYAIEDSSGKPRMHVYLLRVEADKEQHTATIRNMPKRLGYGAIQVRPGHTAAQEIEITRNKWNSEKSRFKVTPTNVVLHPPED